jgi:DAK2 domain fusion protein YloV
LLNPQTGILDVSTLRRAMALFAEALRQHRDEINSLNVFPVPDGDTGTNMLLTQEAVERSLAGLDGKPNTLAGLGHAVSEASLMGARGNSGVILSQVLRGLWERFPPDGVVEPATLATALRHASDEAERAVARPMDGTVLSVLRDAATAAEGVAGSAKDCAAVAAAVLDAARESLASTRDMLPELRSAGVVDAGAKGMVLLFDALDSALRGGELTEPVEALGPVRMADDGEPVGSDPELGFEVQYLLEAEDATPVELRRRLTELGDSVVVVGGGGMFNVHVHTDEPGQAVEAGLDHGRPRDISIVHLGTQVIDCIAGQARGVRVAEQVAGLVAVAEGEGVARTFRSLGAMVVPGGPGHNPAVGELLAAVEAAPADAVLLLPNHPNVVPAAEKAAQSSSKEVHVVASPSVPAGLAAATAFNPMAALDENAGAMEAAVRDCRSGEVAQAERAAQTPAGPVRAGDWLGMADGRVMITGRDAESVAGRLAIILSGGGAEIATVVAGEDSSDETAGVVARIVADAIPGVRVDVVLGGQPRYAYLIGVE